MLVPLITPITRRRIYLRAKYLAVKMHNPGDHCEADLHHLVMGQGGSIEVIIQGSQRVVMRHQPQLSTRVAGRHVTSHVPEDIFVAKQNRTADKIEIYHHQLGFVDTVSMSYATHLTRIFFDP